MSEMVQGRNYPRAGRAGLITLALSLLLAAAISATEDNVPRLLGVIAAIGIVVVGIMLCRDLFVLFRTVLGNVDAPFPIRKSTWLRDRFVRSTLPMLASIPLLALAITLIPAGCCICDFDAPTISVGDSGQF